MNKLAKKARTHARTHARAQAHTSTRTHERRRARALTNACAHAREARTHERRAQTIGDKLAHEKHELAQKAAGLSKQSHAMWAVRQDPRKEEEAMYSALD